LGRSSLYPRFHALNSSENRFLNFRKIPPTTKCLLFSPKRRVPFPTEDMYLYRNLQTFPSPRGRGQRGGGTLTPALSPVCVRTPACRATAQAWRTGRHQGRGSVFAVCKFLPHRFPVVVPLATIRTYQNSHWNKNNIFFCSDLFIDGFELNIRAFTYNTFHFFLLEKSIHLSALG